MESGNELYHQHETMRQYASLQALNQIVQRDIQYNMTGSGSILIEDVAAATRLLRKLGPPRDHTINTNPFLPSTGTGDTAIDDTVSGDTAVDDTVSGETVSGDTAIDDTAASNLVPTGHVLTFDDNDIMIQLEWNQLRNHLILRRKSGDQGRYANICHQLMQNI